MKSTLAAAALVVVFGSVHAAEAPQKPDPTETLFWQSTERLATPEAYRAYLAAYPHGLFAPLANAALSGPAQPAAAAAPVPVATSAAALTPFSEEAESGSVNFKLGEVFNGPVALTVGWLGARRQLVLPAGRWVALSALDEIKPISEDQISNPKMVRAKLTTATFGKFNGTRLTSLLSFTFSAEKTQPLAWRALPPCQASAELPIRSAPAVTRGLRDDCVALGVKADPLADGSASSVETLKSLSRLGATRSGPALVGAISFGERRHGFLQVTRFESAGEWTDRRGQALRDWSPAALETSEARAAFADRFWAWIQSYRDAAALGYTNDFEGPAEDFSAAGVH